MTTSPEGVPNRTTVRIPSKNGEELEGWLYEPAGPGPHPAVVMGHGMGAVKAGGLAPFAERFSREGFVVVAFDYRQWANSSGSPRDEVNVPRQREDYEAVIAWAAAQPNVDVNRLFAWGTSFSGLHVTELAASDHRLAGAIAQCPLVDGLTGTTLVRPTRLFRLVMVALVDRMGSLLGLGPIYIPISVGPGQWGVFDGPDALFGKKLLSPREPADWNNRVAARSLLGFSRYRPARRARRIRIPLLLVVPETDTQVPIGPALRVAETAQSAELHRSAGGHYDVYEGGVAFDDTLRREVEFLRRHAGGAA